MRPDPEVLAAIVARVVEVARPERVVLFGSGARGEMRPDSDLDLLVIVPEGVHRRKTAQDLYQHVRVGTVPVDYVVATEADVKRLGDDFSTVFYPATREGVEVYAS